MAITKVADLDLDQDAWNAFLYYALRGELYYDALADVKGQDTVPGQGARVGFTIMTDLAAATSALTEDVDVTPATMGDSQVFVSLVEYGNAVKTTRLVRGTSFVPVNPAVANLIGFNAGNSINLIAQVPLIAGTNVRYGGAATSRVTVAATHTLAAANVRRAKAELIGARVQRRDGGYFAALIHPDQEYDLRGETGAAAWRDPHTYSAPEAIWRGETGEFEGFRFVVDSYGKNFVDAGVGGTVDVYAALFLGQQGLAKAFSKNESQEHPELIPGPVTDTLRRFVPFGWYWLGGYGRFREAALRRVETASSIGAN